jgi:uncharacterized protein
MAKVIKFRNTYARSLALGILTPLLPCAWLMSFTAGASLTESTIKGALFMGVFWLGTIPALAIFPVIRKVLSQKAGRQMNRLAGGLFVVAALSLVIIRVLSIYQQHSCH